MEVSSKRSAMRILRNLFIELIVYGSLVVVYAAVVLKFLNQPLANLFGDNLTLYAVAALLLVVGQGVLLEELTSFLMGRLRLTKFE
jgi:hypothetical protein